jgi:nitrogenase molybdenum-iron protein NifN
MELSKKPLQINPIKLSQPMGAHLCFLGIEDCMPLMHSAQGCTSFSKVFFTRHFSEPIAVQTTAVNDITAVIDGGDYSISKAIKNITKKVQPKLVGLFTTGITETKGDDIKGATLLLKDIQKICYVNTPDFEGGLESGFAKSISAIIDQLVEPKESIDTKKALIIPNVNLTPYEVEQIKDAVDLFGFESLALPDLSKALDGHLAEKQGALSSGGISLEEIEALADSAVVITVGDSVKVCANKLLEKNDKITHIHIRSLGGLINVDNFYKELIKFKEMAKPPKKVDIYRARLQDALLDTHFAIGSKRFAIALEPDQVVPIADALIEAGATISLVVSTQKSEQLDSIEADRVIIGDLDDLEQHIDEFDVIISNFHAERLAKKYHKKVVFRGFPNYEEVGNQLKSDILYQGSYNLLFEVANKINLH